MAVRNHNLRFRPLCGGIAIFNPAAGGAGTLGLIATADGTDRWIVSCHHVLGRPAGAAFPDGEGILQPPNGGPSSVVALTSATRADRALDCAAALVDPAIPADGSVLELPPLTAAVAAQRGMSVIKSGAVTGVTQGVISDVSGDLVTIGIEPGCPPDYDLSDIGDSGAVWIARDTGGPVALHRAGSSSGRERAFGVRFDAVLQALQLRML
jgi:hypothetical protein